MSNGIRRYDPDTEWFDDAQELDVRAVMGGARDAKESSGRGRSVQFTIGREFIVLTEAQVLDLMGVLSKRLACAGDFSATASQDEYTVEPDGSKSVEETSW